jgi:hypothetical protein
LVQRAEDEAAIRQESMVDLRDAADRTA